MSLKLKILVAPLDWGLGHVTRCLPLIAYLEREGHEVFAAGSGATARLLQANFPQIPIVALPGYEVRYATSGRAFLWKICQQLPKLWRAIRRERRVLRRLQHQMGFDVIISDNRYGLALPGVPSVIMTHQLLVQTGLGSYADLLFQSFHYRLLNRFSACWVVDVPGTENLAGRLAHPEKLPQRARYIGWLSQMMLPGRKSGQRTTPPDPNRILILLSGPEPMRSQLEALLWQSLAPLTDYHFVFVAGNDRSVQPTQIPAHVRYHPLLTARQICREMEKASLVICRSGYSTLMDLVCLGKKALLIPTPGQTEQEYLAGHLSATGVAYAVNQDDLALAAQIPKAMTCSGLSGDGNLSLLIAAFEDFLSEMVASTAEVAD